MQTCEERTTMTETLHVFRELLGWRALAAAAAAAAEESRPSRRLSFRQGSDACSIKIHCFVPLKPEPSPFTRTCLLRASGRQNSQVPTGPGPIQFNTPAKPLLSVSRLLCCAAAVAGPCSSLLSFTSPHLTFTSTFTSTTQLHDFSTRERLPVGPAIP
jgi:hypothetical protein